MTYVFGALPLLCYCCAAVGIRSSSPHYFSPLSFRSSCRSVCFVTILHLDTCVFFPSMPPRTFNYSIASRFFRTNYHRVTPVTVKSAVTGWTNFLARLLRVIIPLLSSRFFFPPPRETPRHPRWLLASRTVCPCTRYTQSRIRKVFSFLTDSSNWHVSPRCCETSEHTGRAHTSRSRVACRRWCVTVSTVLRTMLSVSPRRCQFSSTPTPTLNRDERRPKTTRRQTTRLDTRKYAWHTGVTVWRVHVRGHVVDLRAQKQSAHARDAV